MKIKKGLKKEYKKYVKKNSNDSYSKAVVVAGEDVGKALDEGKTPEEAERAMHGHDLTGFMAGAIAQTIAYFHPRGDKFRIWWNKQYGISEDKKGVVNPAIMTLKSKN